jgi:hypothetical protein
MVPDAEPQPVTASKGSLARQGRVALVVVGILFLAGACFFAYRSGCVFDGKQGYGDAARGQFYDGVTGILLLAEVGVFALVAWQSSRGPGQALLLVTAVIVLVGPVSLYSASETGTRGIIACKPG